ncbi:MAG: hypothetical protein ACRD4H_13510, partial [Candidatus Acidiferrales bacterium]
MRVNMRELRRRLSGSAEGIMPLSCINPAVESTESAPRFPLAATLSASYNAPSRPSGCTALQMQFVGRQRIKFASRSLRMSFLDYIESHREENLNELKEFLR